MRFCATLVLIAAFAPVQAAEMPPLTADRPGFCEATDVLPYRFQWEGGFNYTRGREPGASTVALPWSLFRVGISPRLELRVGGAGYLHSAGASGFSDHEFSAKVALAREAGRRPALSIIGGVSAPVGAGAVSSGTYDPRVALAWAKDAGAGVGLYGSINFASATGGSGRTLQRASGIAASRDLLAGFSGLAEVYAVKTGDAAAAWAAGSGVTHALGPNAQFDIQFGRALAHSEMRWFIGFGVVVRPASQ